MLPSSQVNRIDYLITMYSSEQRPLPFEHHSLLSLHLKHKSWDRRHVPEGWMSARYREDIDVREPYYVRSRAEFNSQVRYPRSRRGRVLLPTLRNTRNTRSLLQYHPLSQRSIGFEPFETDSSPSSLMAPTHPSHRTHHRQASGPVLGLGENLGNTGRWEERVLVIPRSNSTAEIEGNRCRFPRPTPYPVIPIRMDSETLQQRIVLRRLKKPVPIPPVILFQAPPARKRANIRKKLKGIGLARVKINAETGKTEEEQWEDSEDDYEELERQKEWWESDSEDSHSRDLKETAGHMPIHRHTAVKKTATPGTRTGLADTREKRPASCPFRYRVPALRTRKEGQIRGLQEESTKQEPNFEQKTMEIDEIQEKNIEKEGILSGFVGENGEIVEENKEIMEGNIKITLANGKPTKILEENKENLAFLTTEDGFPLSDSLKTAANGVMRLTAQQLPALHPSDTGKEPNLEAHLATITDFSEISEENTEISHRIEEFNGQKEEVLGENGEISHKNRGGDKKQGENVENLRQNRGISSKNSDIYDEIDALSQEKSQLDSDLPGITEESTGDPSKFPQIHHKTRSFHRDFPLENGKKANFMREMRRFEREETWAGGSDPVDVLNVSFHSDSHVSHIEKTAIFPPNRAVSPKISHISDKSPDFNVKKLPLASIQRDFPRSNVTSISNSTANTTRNEEQVTTFREFSKRIAGKMQGKKEDLEEKREGKKGSEGREMRPVSEEGKSPGRVRASLHVVRRSVVEGVPRDAGAPSIDPVSTQSIPETPSEPALVPPPDPSHDPFEELILRISTSVLSIINQMISEDPKRVAKKLQPLVSRTVVQPGARRGKINWEPSVPSAVVPRKREEEKQKSQTQVYPKPQPRSTRKPISQSTRALKSTDPPPKRISKHKSAVRIKVSSKADDSSIIESSSVPSSPSSHGEDSEHRKMTDYELGRMTLMHMLAADLLKSATETPEPSEIDLVLKDPDSDTELTERRNRGFDVQRRLQAMFDSVRMPMNRGLMVGLEMELRPRRPPPSRETTLPEEIIIDRKNRDDIRQTLKFQSKVATLPSHSTLLSSQHDLLFQLDSQQLVPEEVKEYYKRWGRNRRQERTRKTQVALNAKKEFTFSGLEQRYFLNKFAETHQKMHRDLPPIRLRKEEHEWERVYGHLKHASAELLFPVTGRQRYESLESSMEGLEQVAWTHRSLV